MIDAPARTSRVLELLREAHQIARGNGHRLTLSNLYGITRNRLIYCATFCRTNLLDLVEVYAVESDPLVEEARRQIAVSRNQLVHFTVRKWWVVEHGRRVVPEE